MSVCVCGRGGGVEGGGGAGAERSGEGLNGGGFRAHSTRGEEELRRGTRRNAVRVGECTHPIVLSLYLSKEPVTKRSTRELLPTPASPNKTTFTSRGASADMLPLLSKIGCGAEQQGHEKKGGAGGVRRRSKAAVQNRTTRRALDTDAQGSRAIAEHARASP